jgi:hypothetical protein
LIERNLPKRDHHTEPLQQAQLFQQIGTAAIKLGRRGFIIGRRTTNDGGNIAVLERKTVILMNRPGLIGESIAVKGFKEPISASISGKDTSGPISTMRRRRQPYHE